MPAEVVSMFVLEVGNSQVQNVSCDFGVGGGEHTIERGLQNHSFGGVRKWDWSGLCPFPLRKMTGREQGGGESYHRWGCPKLFLGRDFMVCFCLT